MDKKDCNFERDETHQFQVGEEVYVLDKNKLDIYEAIIEKIGKKYYSVHYPEYPDDDGPVGFHRVLMRTTRNKEIYDQQEAIRRRREAEAEEEEEEANEEEDSSSENAEEEEKGHEEEEEKKEKPKKEKAPRKPREPKPKKERAPRKPKPKKPSAAAIGKSLAAVLREAKNTHIKSVPDFEGWLDENYQSDEIVLSRRSELVERFTKMIKKRERVHVAVTGVDYSSASENYSDYDEEEIKYERPEIIRVPPPKLESQIGGTGVKFPGCLSFASTGSEEKDTDMTIQFEDGCANCFIYKTATYSYLILNGMKFRIKTEDRFLDDKELFDENEVEQIDNAQTTSVLYPARTMNDTVQLMYPPEYGEYLEMVQKEKKRDRVTRLDDITLEDVTDGKRTRKTKQSKKIIDDDMSNEYDTD